MAPSSSSSLSSLCISRCHSEPSTYGKAIRQRSHKVNTSVRAEAVNAGEAAGYSNDKPARQLLLPLVPLFHHLGRPPPRTKSRRHKEIHRLASGRENQCRQPCLGLHILGPRGFEACALPRTPFAFAPFFACCFSLCDEENKCDPDRRSCQVSVGLCLCVGCVGVGVEHRHALVRGRGCACVSFVWQLAASRLSPKARRANDEH